MIGLIYLGFSIVCLLSMYSCSSVTEASHFDTLKTLFTIHCAIIGALVFFEYTIFFMRIIAFLLALLLLWPCFGT